MTVYVNKISVIGPNLIDQEKVQEILRGHEDWQYQKMPVHKLDLLPANERRRMTQITKLALICIQELLVNSDDLENISTVFASSDGDFEIIDKICSALAEEERIISPTVFHNSVHNAAAGYWSIASSMQGASTSLSAGDATFICGLQEAVTQVEAEGGTVFFVAYDYPAPQLLYNSRPFDFPLAISMRLGKVAEHKSLGVLTLKGLDNKGAPSCCKNISLEPLRLSSPVGCGLPLIEALSLKVQTQIIMPYLREQNFKILISH